MKVFGMLPMIVLLARAVIRFMEARFMDSDFEAIFKANVCRINFRIRYRLLDVLRKKIREAEKMEEAIEEEKTRLDDGNRHRASRMPVLRVNEIALKDPSFWEEVRSRLSDKQWKWVQYFIIADMSIKEIMEIEGVTADAVKGWGQGVRKKLRDQEVRKMLEEMM